MTDSVSPALNSSLEPAAASRALLAVVGITALSDWLFWGHGLGISVVLYLGVVVIAVLVVNPAKATLFECFKAGSVAVVAFSPLVEDVNLLSFLFGAVGVATFALMVTGNLTQPWPASVLEPVKLLCVGPLRLIPDFVAMREKGALGVPSRLLVNWAVPLAFSVVFLFLFSSANPMIEKWLSSIEFIDFWELFNPGRVIFWLVSISIAWGLISARRVICPGLPKSYNEESSQNGGAEVGPGRKQLRLFSSGAILRSLILFNLLFGVQTVLDIAFLWRGASLPEGMSYAAYAQRGAYPLMITTALAALFVVGTFGPGKPLESSRLARGLVFVWIAQNVLLVVSSLQRLSLYVEVYSLSYLRVAAFIWMGLVVMGLLLITWRIALKRTNSWLIGNNLAVTIGVLYACCFINFADLIARYNIEHSREVSGRGVSLDRVYLGRLGPHAVPAIDLYLATLRDQGIYSLLMRDHLCSGKFARRENVFRWRSWSFRDFRLAQYLKKNGSEC